MIEEARIKVEQWLGRHHNVVLYDAAAETLMDVASGKSVRFPWRDLVDLEEKIHAETGEPYWVCQLNSGVQVVLVDPGGVAFAPSEVNTGPLSSGPEVVCLRDFAVLVQRVDHHLREHREEAVPREYLDAVMLCIAILDGARDVGFDVGDLEQTLERSLKALEHHGLTDG